MVKKSIQFYLLLISFFSFIELTIDKKEINVEFEENKYSFNEKNTKSFKLIFKKDSIIEKYIQIKKISKNNSNQIALLSKSDEECKSDRLSIGIQKYGDINFFVKKEQILDNELYLCIQCRNEENCEYNIDIIQDNYCRLSLNQQYSYYVNKENIEMDFLFTGSNNLQLKQLENVNSMAYFWAKGKDKLDLNFISNDAIIYSYDYGKITFTEYSSEKEYFFQINSKEGDYISIGSIIIDGKESSENLKINDFEIIGLLTKDNDEICFPIDQNYNSGNNNNLRINGNIFTKKAKSYFKDSGNEFQTKKIENGFIDEHVPIDKYSEGKSISFCLSHLLDNEKSFVIFSLQLIVNNNDYSQLIHSPQIPGIIYYHYLNKGEISVFQGMTPNKDSKEINFNMKSIEGFPELFFDECQDFPNCIYDSNKLTYSSKPHISNRMTFYSFYLKDLNKDFTPITSYQPLIIVKCKDTEEENLSDNCIFETSIFTNQDRLKIIEGETFSQYLLEGEKDLYTISLENEEKLDRVYLHLIIFSGDVHFVIETENLSSRKYFMSNKIFYSIEVPETVKKIDFSISAQKKSFYMVQYQLTKTNDEISQKRNKIESGVNFIEGIFLNQNNIIINKYIDLLNFKKNSGIPYLANFYSQNCMFSVKKITYIEEYNKKEYEILDVSDNYAQTIIENNDLDEYNFEIMILGDDDSNYNNKMCVLYITGLELSNSNIGVERSISVSEGVPQYYVFSNNYPFIKYSYHISDRNNAVIINLNLLDKTKYIVLILFNNEVYKNVTIYRNDNIFVYSSDLENKCPEDEICTMNVDIILENKNDEKLRKLETTIYQVDGAPIYLEKNQIKQDILIGNKKKYYYFDVGKYDMGDITINYKRGSGHIYAVTVNKTDMEYFENAEWRGIYTFPKGKNKTLPYDTYLKKITIPSENTQNCFNGCYVLITIENSDFRENIEDKEEIYLTPYRFTITPRIIGSDDYLLEGYSPVIKMRVNDFVIGNIFPSSNKIYEYYKITLPYESEFIFIDWQADKSSLFINVGEERPQPTEEGSDFHFYCRGFDTTFKLTKYQIIKKLKEKNIDLPYEDSIRNVHLTLGIFNSEIDSLYTSIYAFKISMPPTVYFEDLDKTESFEIIHIRSDQKVQCEPFEYENEQYACIFAVIFDDGDVGNNLIAYPKSQKEEIKIKFKGAILDAQPIEANDMEFIKEKLRNLEEDYSSDNGEKYIYVENINKQKCLFLEVISEELVIIEVYTSTHFFSNNQKFYPNPSTPQIYALEDKKININFETSQNLLINIVSLSGKGLFYWNTKEEEKYKYFLNGYEDRLTLTSGTNIKENKYKDLIVESTSDILYEDSKAGFVFYLTFYPRNTEYNIDQVKIGRTTEFNYRDSKFPLYFFTELSIENIDISLVFYNYYMNKGDELSYNNMYKIWGNIVSEEDIMEARYDIYYSIGENENTVYGLFDGPLGIISFNPDNIAKFNIAKDKNPYLYLCVDISDEIQNNFNKIGVELSILKRKNEIEEEILVSENVYYNGKFSNEKTNSSSYFIYKLKVDKQNTFMRIELSANSNYVKWVVTSDKKSRVDADNLIEPEKHYLNGRDVMIFEIPNKILKEENLFLIIYIDNDNLINSDIYNFIFKYENGKDRENFFELPSLEDNKINCEIKENENGYKSYSISFYPLYKNIVYYIKGIYKINDEEKIDSIAISESEGYNLQIYPNNNEEIINVAFNNIDRDLLYIKVLANYIEEDKKEFLLYEPFSFIKDIYYTTQKEYKAINAYRIQKYKIIFSKIEEIPQYLNVQLDSNDNNFYNKILSFSTSDQNGKKNRIQLTQLASENSIIIWIKKEQIKEKGFIYMVVECDINYGETCNYLIKLNGYESGLIKSLNFNYNYYVNKDNKIMEFKIENDLETKNEEQIITLYAYGGKNISLIINNNSKDYKQYNFGTGVAITEQLIITDYLLLKIESEEGDFITFGGKAVSPNEKSKKFDLKPNTYEIIGYLKKDLLENECYLMSNNYDTISYISITLFEKIVEISFKDENFDDIKNSKEIVNNGFYSYTHYENNKRKYICLGIPNSNNIEEIGFSLQLTQPLNNIGILNFYSPQLLGHIYERFLPHGTYAFFNSANLYKNSKNIIYNMITTKGMTNMYIYKCQNYPLCESRTFTNDLIEINETSRIFTWRSEENSIDNSPIDSEQYIMIVACEFLKDSIIDECKFQTLVYRDEILLIEKESLSNYLIKEEEIEYIIDISNEKSINEAHIELDILIINGDINITFKSKEMNKINIEEYYLSNKRFYSINLNNNQLLKKLIVNVKANINSYYMIEYKLIKESDNQNKQTLELYSRINHLIHFEPEKTERYINIYNMKFYNDSLFYVNFYPLNCKFSIERIINENNKKEIEEYRNYLVDNINNENELNSIYSYHLKITESDISDYDKNMCMLYVAGLEIVKEKSLEQKEILIDDGIPQGTYFNNDLTKIKYSYIIADKEKNILIFFKVINPGKFYYSLDYNGNYSEENTFYNSYSLVLFNSDFKICKRNELCKIILSLELKETIDEFIPFIEVNIRQINNNIPYYIPKGIVKQDFITQDSNLYLFTTLADKDEGYITVNFARGKGQIYSKIVPLNSLYNGYSDWIKFIFPKGPKDDSDFLYYDFYNKRIIFNSTKTSICGEGCILLISIESPIKDKFDEFYKLYQFSIDIGLTSSKKLNNQNQIIIIEPEEFIIGALSDKEKIKNKKMYAFYQVIIPYNVDKVEFDWQSDTSILLVNVGNKTPENGNAEFIFESRNDTIFELTNFQIKKNLNNIKNIPLTIGVYTEDYETLLGSSYSFRVHFSKDINIHKVSSEQKTLCKPIKINNNEYRCLYMIVFDYDCIYDLMIYARSQSPSGLTYIYGQNITNEIYNSFNLNVLKNIIPDESSRYNTKKQKMNFIFIPKSEIENYIYLSVISDKPEIIELITSFQILENEMSPNPSSIQLFSLNKNKSMKLKFENTYPIIINIYNFYGESILYFEDEKNINYILEEDNRLSLATPNDEKDSVLIIENSKNDEGNEDLILINDKKEIQNPPLAFYLEYSVRSNELNLDEIILGKNSQFVYKNSYFPLYYFSKINNNPSHNINYIFTLLDLIPEMKEIKSGDITIKGTIIKEKDIYLIKQGDINNNKINENLSILGVYDPTIQVGQISFLPANIEKFNFSEKEKPTIYISFNNLNTKFKENIKLDISAIQENEDIPISEKIYHYGKIDNTDSINYYRLKIDNSTGYMRIQFSSNSKKIHFSISNEKNVKNNEKYDDYQIQKEIGKEIITFKKPVDKDFIYLNVYLNDNESNLDSKLRNYAFKYMNSNSKNNFNEYPILNNKNKIEYSYFKDEKNLSVTFNKIDKNDVDIIYSLKLIKKNNLNLEEECCSIAISEIQSSVIKVKNPNEKEITMKMEEINNIKDYAYIGVIAQIIDGSNIEYVVYEPINLKEKEDEEVEEEDEEDDDNTKLAIVIVLIIIFFLIIFSVLVIVLFYNYKNRNLLSKVNAISFAENEGKERKEDNLLLDNSTD